MGRRRTKKRRRQRGGNADDDWNRFTSALGRSVMGGLHKLGQKGGRKGKKTRKKRQRGRGVFWPFLHPDKRGW